MAEIKRDKNELMIDALQAIDPDITRKVAYSKACVLYELNTGAGSPAWQKTKYEGTCYWIERKTEPKVQIWLKSVKNTDGSEDFKETPGLDWELDCKPNFVFYKTGDKSVPIRGLWFPDDSDRQKWEDMIDRTITQLREAAGMNSTGEKRVEGVDKPDAEAHSDVKDQLASMGKTGPNKAPLSVQVTKASLRTSLHGLVDDDKFMQMLMQKLYEQALGTSPKQLDQKDKGALDLPRGWATPHKASH